MKRRGWNSLLTITCLAITLAAPGAIADREPAQGLRVTEVRDSDTDGDGMFEPVSTERNEYDDQGNRTAQVFKRPSRISSGPITFVRAERTTYDHHGNPLLRVVTYDYDGDGTIEQTISALHRYDNRGLLVERHDEWLGRDGLPSFIGHLTGFWNRRGLDTGYVYLFDGNADGTIDAWQSHRLRYDQRAQLVESVFEEETNEDPHRTVVIRYAYDHRGRIVERLAEQDDDGDGVMDLRRRTRTTYDGRSTNWVEEYDGDGDGTADRIYTGRKAYDARGEIIERVVDYDGDADGTADSREAYFYTRNNRGDLTESVNERGWIGGELVYRETERTRYDSSGNVIETVTETDEDGDGILDSVTTSRRTVDDRSHPIETVFESDADADGTPDRIRTVRETWDSRGNPTSRVEEVDHDADGTVDFVPIRFTWTY